MELLLLLMMMMMMMVGKPDAVTVKVGVMMIVRVVRVVVNLQPTLANTVSMTAIASGAMGNINNLGVAIKPPKGMMLRGNIRLDIAVLVTAAGVDPTGPAGKVTGTNTYS
jgi:uncharacterized membrane protein (DUF441 family)